MSFGNVQLYRPATGHGQEPAQGYAFGHSLGRRSLPRRDIESTHQMQPLRESSAAFSSNSETDLTVLTAEGDQITISLAAQVKYAESSQTGPGGSSQTVATSASSQLRVAVEGDLNETELKDLETLVSNLTQLTSQAISPTQAAGVSTPSPAAPDASASDAGFAGLSSLAAFAYSYNQTLEAGMLVHSRG